MVAHLESRIVCRSIRYSTIQLCFKILERADRDESTAAAWRVNSNTVTTLVVILSSSRIESLAILRLRLREELLVDYPMPQTVFQFTRFCGSHHAILTDLPHLVVAVILLNIDAATKCSHQDLLPSWLDLLPRSTALLSIAFSIGSLLWGWVSRKGNEHAMDAAVSSSFRIGPVSVPRMNTGDELLESMVDSQPQPQPNPGHELPEDSSSLQRVITQLVESDACRLNRYLPASSNWR